VPRPRPIALAGIGAALLGNYWVLAGLLAKRTDPSASWISDLAARSEPHGWRFELLEILSGLAVVGFALLLLRPLGSRSPMIRLGILALVAEGVLTVVGGAAPLNCGESLDPSCSLSYDALDVIHATAELAAIAATVLAFAAIGMGLARAAPQSPAGRVTIAIGAAWLLLTVTSGVSFLSGDVDAVKGLFQRGGQALFGAWLILLGIWASRPFGTSIRSRYPSWSRPRPSPSGPRSSLRPR
jgi:Protein of unknown function (DUF998)